MNEPVTIKEMRIYIGPAGQCPACDKTGIQDADGYWEYAVIQRLVVTFSDGSKSQFSACQECRAQWIEDLRKHFNFAGEIISRPHWET